MLCFLKMLVIGYYDIALVEKSRNGMGLVREINHIKF